MNRDEDKDDGEDENEDEDEDGVGGIDDGERERRILYTLVN